MNHSTKALSVVLGLFCFLTLACITYFQHLLTSGPNAATYFYASHIFSKCHEVETRTEVEEIIKGKASSAQITPSQSLWGNRYTLENGEYMIQYMVNNAEQIDIVYSAQHQIISLFESYE